MDYQSNTHTLKFSDLIRIGKRHIFIIIFFTLIGLISASIYAYYKPNIYQSKATIQIGKASKTEISNDILKEALTGSSSAIETEMQIITSRSMVLSAMKQVDLATHIWGENKFHKKDELYLKSPFTVNIEKGKGLKFKLTPIDKESFYLELKDDKKKFKKKYKYSELIDTKDFKLSVYQTGLPFEHKSYEFVIYDPNKYVGDVIKNHLSVSKLSPKSNIVKVTYTDTVPQRAREFLNTLVKTYMTKSVKSRTQDASKTLNFINKQLNGIKKDLKKSEHNIEQFKSKEKTVDLSLSVQQISQKLSDYESQLAILNMQLSILNKNIAKLKKGQINSLTFAGIGVDTQNMTSLIKDLQQAVLDRNALLEEYTNAHPEVHKLSQKIQNLKKIIKESVYNIKSSLNAKKSIITAQIKKYNQKLSELPKAQQQSINLKRKYEFNNKFYKYLLEKKTETEIKKSATVNRNKIVDLAYLPIDPIAPNKKVITIIGFISGLILGLIFALIRDMMDDTIHSEKEFRDSTDEPIIATIPKFKINRKNKYKLIVQEEPTSYASECFKTLRTNILLNENEFKKGNEGVVISISSSIMEEGKTSISSNLAASISMLNKKVILIDFDLRLPSLNEVFQVTNDKGLSSYLSKDINLSDVIIKDSNLKNLDLIISGKLPSNPSELIYSDKTKEMINILKKQYDYIILDTPPVGLVSDAKLLLKLSDINLYVFKLHYSKKEFLKFVEDLKEKDNLENIGIVINNAKTNPSKYDKYYKAKA